MKKPILKVAPVISIFHGVLIANGNGNSGPWLLKNAEGAVDIAPKIMEVLHAAHGMKASYGAGGGWVAFTAQHDLASEYTLKSKPGDSPRLLHKNQIVGGKLLSTQIEFDLRRLTGRKVRIDLTIEEKAAASFEIETEGQERFFTVAGHAGKACSVSPDTARTVCKHRTGEQCIFLTEGRSLLCEKFNDEGRRRLVKRNVRVITGEVVPLQQVGNCALHERGKDPVKPRIEIK